MNRACFTLRLAAGQEDRYDRLHAELPAPVVEAIHRAGIANYSIFRRGQLVVGYAESEGDFYEALTRVAMSDAYLEWAKEFDGVFAAAESRPLPLSEVWHA